MIVIKVELWSAITGKRTELGRMMIANEGGTDKLGDYSGRTYRGRDTDSLDRSMENNKVTRTGQVLKHPRLSQHVWNLVAKMLINMGYGT